MVKRINEHMKRLVSRARRLLENEMGSLRDWSTFFCDVTPAVKSAPELLLRKIHVSSSRVSTTITKSLTASHSVSVSEVYQKV